MQVVDFKMRPWNVMLGAGTPAGLPAHRGEPGVSHAPVLSTLKPRGEGERVAALLRLRAFGLLRGARQRLFVWRGAGRRAPRMICEESRP